MGQAKNKAMKEIMKQFNGRLVSFTPKQIEYIQRMFEQKGPVLVRVGTKKKTRFHGPSEWEKIKNNKKEV